MERKGQFPWRLGTHIGTDNSYVQLFLPSAEKKDDQSKRVHEVSTRKHVVKTKTEGRKNWSTLLISKRNDELRRHGESRCFSTERISRIWDRAKWHQNKREGHVMLLKQLETLNHRKSLRTNWSLAELAEYWNANAYIHCSYHSFIIINSALPSSRTH